MVVAAAPYPAGRPAKVAVPLIEGGFPCTGTAGATEYMAEYVFECVDTTIIGHFDPGRTCGIQVHGQWHEVVVGLHDIPQGQKYTE